MKRKRPQPDETATRRRRAVSPAAHISDLHMHPSTACRASCPGRVCTVVSLASVFRFRSCVARLPHGLRLLYFANSGDNFQTKQEPARDRINTFSELFDLLGGGQQLADHRIVVHRKHDVLGHGHQPHHWRGQQVGEVRAATETDAAVGR